MESTPGANIVDAIYELRSAVETKVRAEQAAAAEDSRRTRDALLAAQLDVEAKTQDAIDVCHECGADAQSCAHRRPIATIDARHDNVVHVDFGGPAAETA